MLMMRALGHLLGMILRMHAHDFARRTLYKYPAKELTNVALSGRAQATEPISASFWPNAVRSVARPQRFTRSRCSKQRSTEPTSVPRVRSPAEGVCVRTEVASSGDRKAKALIQESALKCDDDVTESELLFYSAQSPKRSSFCDVGSLNHWKKVVSRAAKKTNMTKRRQVIYPSSAVSDVESNNSACKQPSTHLSAKLHCPCHVLLDLISGSCHLGQENVFKFGAFANGYGTTKAFVRRENLPTLQLPATMRSD